MMNKDLDTPIWQLTVREFIELHQSLIQFNISNMPETVTTTSTSDERYVYGIDGIAKLFSCSRATANKIKSSGKIDKAVKQYGRKIVVDASMALDLFGKHK